MLKCVISQGFGANENPLYHGEGLKGHTGCDEMCGYGTNVYALKQGFVYKVLDADHPANDGSGYWAVYIISREPNGQYCEWQIGHLSKIFCEEGDPVNPWTIIGQEGNHGQVYSGGILITKAMQDAGDHRGSHRHWNKKIVTRMKGKAGAVYLTQFPTGAFHDKEGMVYAVENYNNGYNGSVDPSKDIDDGYLAVTAYLSKLSGNISPSDEKLAESAISTAKEALKYPSKAAQAIDLLNKLSIYLFGNKK